MNAGACLAQGPGLFLAGGGQPPQAAASRAASTADQSIAQHWLESNTSTDSGQRTSPQFNSGRGSYP